MGELSIIQKIAIWIIPVLFAITLHEVAHGLVALWCGDRTAKFSGRLTLNPVKHIELLGTIIMPLLTLVMSNFSFIFGWAKPVPVDPRNLHSPRRDMALVAFAGPIANILMALFWGVINKIGMHYQIDGLVYMGYAGVIINAVLAVLNLIPLPPLDGSKILLSILPPRMAYYFSLIEPYSFVILILLLITGVFSYVLTPLVNILLNFITYLINLIPI